MYILEVSRIKLSPVYVSRLGDDDVGIIVACYLGWVLE